MELLDFLGQQRYTGANRIYLAPHIPEKLLNNALASYDLDVDPGEILVLIDDTLLGSGKDGCLIGRRDIAFKQAFADPVAITFSHIKTLEVKGLTILLNAEKASSFSIPDKAHFQHFFMLFKKWLAVRLAGPQQLASPSRTEAQGLQELSDEQVLAFSHQVLSIAQRLAPERVFVHPHIPPKKLHAALASYGANLAAADVMVLIDDTLFGSAKEGMLFCRQTLALKMVFESPRTFMWRHVEAVAVSKSELHINRKRVGSFTQVGEKELGELFVAINGALKKIVQAGPDAGAVVATRPKTVTGSNGEQSPRPERTATPERPGKPSTKDKLLEYIANAIEQNKSKIIPFLMEKTGEVSIAALRNDEHIEKLAGILYALLPGFVRLALKEHVFVGFVLEHRTRILDKLLAGESEPPILLPAPAVTDIHAFDDDLDELLGSAPPTVDTTGRFALEKFQSLSRALQEADVDPQSRWLLQLPIQSLNAVLAQGRQLTGFTADEADAQILFALALMYGYSFHKLPDVLRRQGNVFKVYFSGLMLLCEHYQARPRSRADAKKETISIAYGMAKIATKDELNSVVRKLLHGGGAAQRLGAFEMESIIGLLRQANQFAVQWSDATTCEMLEKGAGVSELMGALAVTRQPRLAHG